MNVLAELLAQMGFITFHCVESTEGKEGEQRFFLALHFEECRVELVIHSNAPDDGWDAFLLCRFQKGQDCVGVVRKACCAEPDEGVEMPYKRVEIMQHGSRGKTI